MSLMDRILLAVVEALDDDDPIVLIGVGDRQLMLSWPEQGLAEVLPFIADGAK